MPHFRYIGDRDGSGPEVTVAFGHPFIKNGAPVEVRDAHAARKLSGNHHFVAVAVGAPVAVYEPAHQAAAPAVSHDPPLSAGNSQLAPDPAENSLPGARRRGRPRKDAAA